MLQDRVSNPGPLTYESGALPIALRGPTGRWEIDTESLWVMDPRLRLRRFRLERVSNSGPLDQ